MYTKINVQIGDTSVTLIPIETQAPVDYDGFGTFTIANYGDDRTVLVREEHVEWQRNRYCSGNYTSIPSIHLQSTIEEELWKKLQGRS